MVSNGVTFTHQILDNIDSKLTSTGSVKLARLVELANLSSIVGNLIGTGIANSSKGVFKRNGPHKYPDLLAKKNNASDIEIKVSLEKNKPKGHLAKPGKYLTFRYILGDHSGNYVKGKSNRGDVVWIWEIRFGSLQKKHFNLSNTPGDSGKTAVINADGFENLKVIYTNQNLF